MGFVMHEGQVEVAPCDLAAAIATQFADLAGLSMARVESAGTVVAPFRVGDNLVARLPLVPTHSDAALYRMRREQEYALVLADHLQIAVPRPFSIGEPLPGYPGIWSLWTWLPGLSLDRWSMDRDSRLANELAAVIRTIQELPTGGRSWNGEGRGGRPLADTRWVRESIDRSAHLVDRHRATALWERALAAHPHPGPALRLHGDPTPGNFLSSDGRLSGMVDVALPSFGDPAADLQPAWVLFEEPARAAILTAVGLGGAARERGRGWAFEMAIGGVHYYEKTNPVFFRQAMRTLERLLAEGESDESDSAPDRKRRLKPELSPSPTSVRSSAMCSEEDANRLCCVPTQRFGTRHRVVAQQHGFVDRRAHHEPVKGRRRRERVGDYEKAPPCQRLQDAGERPNLPPRPVLEQRPGESGKAPDLADDQASQLQQPGSQDDREFVDGVPFEIGSHIGGYRRRLAQFIGAPGTARHR